MKIPSVVHCTAVLIGLACVGMNSSAQEAVKRRTPDGTVNLNVSAILMSDYVSSAGRREAWRFRHLGAYRYRVRCQRTPHVARRAFNNKSRLSRYRETG
jgi:hypothetical protein